MQEVRAKVKAEEAEEAASVPTSEREAEDDEDEGASILVCGQELPKKKKQRRICEKYGIKEKQLNAATEQARKLFVPRMGAKTAPKLLVAIIELLEFGDI